MATQTLGKTYRITKRKIKAIPNLKTPVFAGVDLRGGDYSSVITPNIVESWKMEGLPEGVDDIYKIDGLLEYFALVFRSGNKEELVEDNRYKGLLTSGDEFFVTLDESDYMGANYPVFFKSRLDSFGFNASYGLDYEVRAEEKTFVPVRDHATVTSSDADGSGFEDMQVEASYSHEPGVYEWTDLITAPAGVPVDYDTHGHSMTFNIHKPAEFGQGGRDKSFRSDFAFREDIAKAVKAYGGDPENEGVVTMDDDYITVRLDADLICETDSKKISFDIIWDVGQNYVEHFTVDLNDTALFADLREAVSPKSFSLVSDRKKMAVGDTMQLDARIKKNQNSDLILLAYESDKPEVLNVTGGFEEVRKTDQVGGSFYGAGFLTALKPGNATITAWPCRMAYDAKTGKAVKEKIKDAKPASVKITVTDVEAVKSVKITPHDTGAAFTYKMPANGFRREVYVLPGKAKPADFENKISAVKNGDHSAFTYVRLGYTEISFDKASGKYVKAVPGNEVLRDGDNLPLTLGNLKPDSQYTLYIRNVSGIRNIDGSRSGNALADSGALHAEGIEVSSLVTEEGALQSLTENPSESASGDDGELQEAGAGTSLVVSSVAGSVKTFKTGKEEPSGIGLSVNALDREDANEDNTQFMVKLSKKNVQIDAFGYFEDTSEGADDGDVITKPIPLKGPEAKAYGKQKLSFAVIDEGAKELPANTEPRKSDRKLYACYTDGNGDKFWYEKSRIAKISNKGKLTLLGQGLVKIICIDAVSGEQGEIKAFIDADPDSVAVGKKAAKDLVLQPGESMWLSSVLEYKEGKTAVAAYQGYTRTIDDDSSYIHMYADLAVYDESDEIKLYSDTTLSDEYYSIERKTIKDIPYWNASAHEVGRRDYHDYRIKALKSGGTKTLNVTDSLAGTVTVNLSEAPIEPVKQITAAWKDPVTGENVGIIRDNDIYGFFTHSAKGVDAAPESSYSGTLKARVSLYDMTHRNPLYSEVQEHTPLCFDAKKKVWVYCWGWTGLTSSQQYRVGIRVLNSDGSEASEEKIFKFKTTDIPASHADLSLAFLGYVDGEFGYTRLDEHTGGVDYNISEGAVYFDREDASTKLSSLPVLTSGNTYTLTPVLGDGDCDTELLEKRPLEPGEKWVGGLAFSTVNTASSGRCSDKLVWKVSDKKVLKVKPKAGTYNAALTALKPGTSEITVSSKITKKVIMRRTVTVGAVAGGDAFFGENEPYNRSYNWGYSYETPEDTTLESDILEITLDNPIRVQLEPYSNRWFVFEAPAYGRYTFRIGTSDLSGKVELEKGQKYYLRLSGREYVGTYYLSVEGEIFEPVSGDSFIVTAGSKTATLFSPTDEENYYIFSFVNDKGETRYLTGFTSAEGLEMTGDAAGSGATGFISFIGGRQCSRACILSSTGNGENEGSRNSSLSAAGALSDSHRFIADKVSKMETGFGLRRGDVLQIILDDNYMGITKGKNYRFTVTKCSVKDSLTLGEELAFSMTEPAEAEQWFSFTAPEEGVYTFKRKDTEGSAKLSWSYASSFMDDETRGKNKGTVINEEPDPDIDLPIEKGTYACALDKGEVIYLILKAESPGPENPGRGMLSVSFAPVIPVELDGETLTIDVKPGECFYYSITGDEEEEYLQYILKFENGSGQTIQSSDTLKGYFNKHCYSRFIPAPDWSFINNLKKGESFYLRVWNDSEAELKGARIFARHSRVNFLTEKETEGELTRSVFNHGEAYYAFDVPKKKEAGIYRFTFKGTPGLTVSVRKGIGENGELLAGPKNLTEGNDTIVFETDEPLTEFSRHYYTVCTDLGGVVSGKAEEVSFTPLELGENKDLSSKYVCFAAEENEVYDIRFFTEGFGIGVIELGSEFFQFNERYDKIENESMSWLTKRDGKIYFKVVLEGGKKYSVTVKKRNAVKLDSGVKYYRIPDDEFGEWFCFQPPDDGRIDYAFYFESLRDFRYYAFIGDTLDEGTGYVLVGNNIKIRSGTSQETEAARLNQGMAQGKPVYFWIRYSDEIPTITDITISVS
ncbi:MAG: hypothetical protein IJT00_00740 [Lachnospiraceae bacterium]|nr:hypothetical protein [Lachnospiraceae bacterium]